MQYRFDNEIHLKTHCLLLGLVLLRYYKTGETMLTFSSVSTCKSKAIVLQTVFPLH